MVARRHALQRQPTLRKAWRGIKNAAPLDFDEFEDAYPEIDNQRFYGFKKIIKWLQR